MSWRGSRYTRILLAGVVWLAFLGATGTAGASNNVTYQGGPVAHSMTGVLVDWGASVNSMYTNETSGDPGLIKYLASQSGSTGDIGGVIAQYMDSSGHNAANLDSYGQQYQITPSVTGTTISDSQIQTELAAQMTAGNLPAPAGNGLGTLYLVLFPSGDVECADATDCSANSPSYPVFCAYHSSFQLSSGAYVLYAVLPDDTSGPMSTDCGASSVFNDQTSYLSHEWAETISDPLGNAWWVNNSSSPDNGNEIGDTCNQIMTTEGGWTVQQQWSNVDGTCMGTEPAYAAPTASFLAPGVAALAQSVSFDASSSTDPTADQTAISGTSYAISSGIAGYTWNWGDGTPNTPTATPTASHTYTALGTYQVSLTVTDDLGFTSTVTHPISITTTGTSNPSVTTGGSTNVSATGATLEGGVNSENQSTQYQFVYGTSPAAMTSSTPLTPGPSGQVNTEVSATVSGLRPSTTYYYELELFSGGQTYYGSVQSFATNVAPPAPQMPIAGTGGASSVGTGSAFVAGTVNPGGSQPVTYRFSYGTSPSNLGSSTYASSGLSGTNSVPVSALLSGLAPNTTYYYRLDIALGSQTYSGSVQSFTTHPGAPGASTGGTTSVTGAAATVTGRVSPGGVATRYLVEFGTTTAYGHSSPQASAGAGSGSVPVSVTLFGLRSRTVYHYRLVAISAGGTTVGGDRTFKTGAPLAPAPRFRFSVSLTRKLEVRFHCSKACSAHFALTVSAAGITRLAPVTVTLARATASLRRHGSRTLTIRLSAAARRRLHQRGLKLVMIGYAASPGSARTAPLAKPVPVRR